MSVPARRHRLATPRRADVRADTRDGRPLVVDGREVDAVRESWLVEDRWWSEQPLRRRYWEVVTTCGRNVVAFHDLRDGGWYRQR
jgi:CO dehydrogenase/acetyl-CoA synthase delta subunit